jgi:hypothetical protein
MLTPVRRLMTHLFRGHAWPYAPVASPPGETVDASRHRAIPDGYMEKLPPIEDRRRDHESTGAQLLAPSAGQESGDRR